MAPGADTKLKTLRAVEPVHARPIMLAAKTTAGEAFTAIASACLQHFAANRNAVAAGRAEGVHQMRVGLRRMRAAMSFFKQLLGDTESRHINHELKWLLGELGPVRDLDVLIEESIEPLRRERIDGAALAALKDELETRRRAGLARAKAAVASARYRRSMRETALWITDGAWTAGRKTTMAAGDFADAEFARRQRNLAKKLKRLEKLDPRQRHKLRVAAKKLRYADEFFASLYDRRGGPKRRLKRHGKALKALQSSLGKLNDMRVHDKMAGDFVRAKQRTDKKPQKAFAFGLISGENHAHIAPLMRAATKAGKRLNATKPFW